MNSVYTSTMFPVNSRIHLPCRTLYEKLSDGEWRRYQNGVLTYDTSLPSNYNFPHGSEMSYNGQRCFVKDSNNWRPVNQAVDAGATRAGNSMAYALPASERNVPYGHGQSLVDPDSAWWSTGLQLATILALTHAAVGPDSNASHEVSSGIQILEQAEYRHGTQPVHDRLVEYLVDMSSAALGDVPDAQRPAYEHDLVGKEKVAIRFGLSSESSCSYRTKQRTIMRSKETTGITRGRLAMLVAQEVRELVDALERNNTPLKGVDGRVFKFEELILVDVKRMSAASVQPTIGIHTA